MQLSHFSLLYAFSYGVQFSPEDLKIIGRNLSQNADDIFETLHSKTKKQLINVNWRDRWFAALNHPLFSRAKFISLFCEDYPEEFRNLNFAPPLVSYLGAPVWKTHKFISVVGSRRPHHESLRWMTYHLTPFLDKSQLGVVSGGARGVDQWAHRISLETSQPTICLIPSGLGEIYPTSLLDIASEIIDRGGAILSTYGFDQTVRKHFFHQRNELIAALGQSCLLVEGGVRSGSLVTARHAAQLGKDVLTLPFSPWLSVGQGSNQLIKEGATLILNEHDLLESCFAGFKFL